MANLCNLYPQIGSKIKSFNNAVQRNKMTLEVLKKAFSFLSDTEYDELLSKAYNKETGGWNLLSEEMFQNNDSEEESPEPTGDPSMDLHNVINYNSSTQNAHKMWASHLLKSAYILGQIKDEFRSRIFSDCVYDVKTRRAKNPTDISKTINSYKLQLAQELNSLLGLGLTLKMDTDAELNISIHDVLNLASKKLDDVTVSEITQLKAKKAFYKLAYFDDILGSLEVVTRNPSVASYEHKIDMYTPKFGKDKVYAHTFSQNDIDLDMDDITTPFIKELFNNLPLVNKEGVDSKNLKVGWNGFQRGITSLITYIKSTGDLKLYEDITNGDMAALGQALVDWLEHGVSTGSIYNSSINEEVIRSLAKFIFPVTKIPQKDGLFKSILDTKNAISEQIRNIIYTQVVKTAKRAYLTYSYDTLTKTMSLDVLEDKAVISESSHLTNILVGRISQIKKDPSLKSSLFGENGIFKKLKITKTAAGPLKISFEYKNKTISFLAQPVTSKKDSQETDKVLSWAFGATQDTISAFNSNDDLVYDLIYDLFGYNLGLPETREDKKVLQQFMQEAFGNKSLINLFSNPICIALLASEGDVASKNDINFEYHDVNKTTIKLGNYFKNYDDLAKFLYWCTGFDSKNVVKDLNGNKIPLYGLVSAIMQYPTLLYKAREARSVANSVYHAMAGTQPILTGDVTVGDPLVRSGISTSTGKKSASEMTEPEILINSAFIDYGQSLLFDTNKKIDGYRGHRFMDGATVFIQPTVFSDKSMQFVLPFTFKKGSNLLKALKNLAKGDANTKAKDEQLLTDYVYKWQSSKYVGLLKQIFDKYQTVYGNEESFKALKFYNEDGSVNEQSINTLNSLIKTKASNLELMRAKFEEAGVELVPEIDYTKKGLNQGIVYAALNIFNSYESTANYFERQKRILVQDIVRNNINLYENIVKIEGMPADWVEFGKVKLYKVYQPTADGSRIEIDQNEFELVYSNGTINPNYEIELNPILNSWFYADGICSQSWEEIFFGLNENNPNKSEDAGDTALSGRLLAQYKRTVSAGSTVHLYQQGRVDGVPQFFNCAVIDDASFAYAISAATGQVYSKDPHDGSALMNPYMAILARNSLGTAADGVNQAKTILHDVDKYGNGILCKWATYAITNAMRRVSRGGKYDLENIHKKMNNFEININDDEVKNLFQNAKKAYGKIFMYDTFLRHNVEIQNINIKSDENGQYFELTVQNCDEYGKTYGDTYTKQIRGDFKKVTLYDLNRAFGGATFKVQNKSNKLEYSELNNEIVVNYLINRKRRGNDYTQNLISYLINGSAIKRGAKNVNSSSAFEDNTPFRTMYISSKMGGLMMATEHDVDGKVHEMSQIMASLVQKGYTAKQARKIYSDIGKIVETTARHLFDGTALSEEKRKEIVENYLVKSLNSSTGKGIGAADSIALYANENVRDENGKVQRITVPFSLSDIRSKFLSVINAYLSNEAIIREYPGIQAVNTPSRGMIQYYNVDGQSYNKEAAERRVGEIITQDEIQRLNNFFGESTTDQEQAKNLAVLRAFKPYRVTDRNLKIRQLYWKLFNIDLDTKSKILSYIEDNKNLSSAEIEGSLKQQLIVKTEDPLVFTKDPQLAKDIKLLSELVKANSSEVITDISEGQFLQKVTNLHNLKIGQTILVRRKGKRGEDRRIIPETRGAIYQKVILESGWQRDRWANLMNSSDYEVYRLELAPEDLKQPQISFSIEYPGYTGETTTEMDLDVTRALFYFRELSNKKVNPEFTEKKRKIVLKVLRKIASFGNKYRFSRKLNELYAKLDEDFMFVENNHAAEILFILRDYQQEIYRQFKLHKSLTKDSEILGDQDFLPSNLAWKLTFNQVDPGEIAISAAYAKELHLEEGDDLGEIMRKGTSFFYDRLEQNYDPNLFAESKDWDVALVNDLGEQVLVKIDDGSWNPLGEDGLPLFHETSEGVDRRATSTFYNGAKICSNEEWTQKGIKVGRIAKNNSSASMKIIVLKDATDLELFADSNLFNNKETKYNFTKENVNKLWDYYKTTLKTEKTSKGKYYVLPPTSQVDRKVRIGINETGLGWLSSLQNHQIAKNEDFKNRVAQRMFSNFEDTLLYFGTRIPSQALQSGMALKVKMFVGANSNQVFIPGAMHWFEGADYDIDKTYMMRLGLVNGKLDLLSDLYDDFGSQCAELPLPNKNNHHEVFVGSEVGSTVKAGLDSNNGRFYYNGVHYVYASAMCDPHKKNSQKMFDTIKKILEDTEANPAGGREIYIVQNFTDPNYTEEEKIKIVQEYADYLQEALETHNNTNMRNPRKVSIGLKNKNVLNARAILLDPETFLCASDPVAFDVLSDFAKASTLGGREKTVSMWNGMTKAIMQSQFQLGKKEIGIIATAIKTFLMKTSVVNNAILKAADLIKQGYYDDALDILSKYVYKVVDLTGTERLGILANANFQPLYDALGQVENVPIRRELPDKFAEYKVSDSPEVQFKKILDDLSSQDAEYDVLMALSSLLSAATDNAKELILSKINASQSTVDLFCSMLGTGYSLEEILRTFSSGLFTIADTLTKSNLYTGADTTKTLAQAIDFVNREGTLLGGRYGKRFNEFMTLPDLLYDKNKEFIGKGATASFFMPDGKTEKTMYLEDFYKNYIADLRKTDPKGTALGDPKNEDPILRMSTREKKVFFISHLINMETLRKLKPKLNELYAKVQERLDKNAGKQKNGDNEFPDYYDSDNAYDDGYGDIESNDDDVQSMVEAAQAEAEAAYDFDPENEGHIGEKKRQDLNLTIDDLTIEDLNTFRDYISNVEYREKMFLTLKPGDVFGMDAVLKNLKNNVIPVASENRILGMIAKINQGLVSNDEDLYNLFKSIEVYFNNESKKFSEEEWELLPTVKTFSLLQFIEDPNIRNSWIQLFDTHKYETNVLRVLAESDNFFNMFKIYKLSHETSRMQYITDLTWKLCDEISNYIYSSQDASSYHKLSTEQYRIVKRVVSDALPFTFLKTLPESIRVLYYKQGTPIYPTGTANQLSKAGSEWDYNNPMISTEDGEIDLGTTEGAATYKRWCESEILTILKNKYKDNKFVRNLHIERKYNPRTRTWNGYLSLGIDMTNISKSVKLQAQFNEVQQDFLKIANDTIAFGGMEGDMPNTVSLKNILYLYDLIQNKGGLGMNSFGQLFGETLRTDIMNQESIIGRYWRYLNSLDTLTDTTAREQFEANFKDDLVKDIVWRLASDQKTKQLINANGEENRIQPLNDPTDGKLYGYTIDGQAIYLIDGDFTFNLPFTGKMTYNQALSLETKKTTHFFNQDVDEDGNITYLNDIDTGKVVTRTLFRNLFSRFPQIEVLEDFDPNRFSEDEINTFKNWPVFALRGKMYVNLSTITSETPARTLIPLMAMVARNYKDANGKYIYRDKWEELLESLKKSAQYEEYWKKTFSTDPDARWYSEFVGQSADDFVLATYIQENVITDKPFALAERYLMTDEEFADSLDEIVNYMFGLNNNKVNMNAFALCNVGELLQNFGALMNTKASNPNSDFNTVAHEDINIKRLIKEMMAKNELSIKNC